LSHRSQIGINLNRWSNTPCPRLVKDFPLTITNSKQYESLIFQHYIGDWRSDISFGKPSMLTNLPKPQSSVINLRLLYNFKTIEVTRVETFYFKGPWLLIWLWDYWSHKSGSLVFQRSETLDMALRMLSYYTI